MFGALYLASSAEGIGRIAWPTGDQAVEEERTERHGGLYWTDLPGNGGQLVRMYLPNYFNTFRELLRRDALYSNLIGNRGTALEQILPVGFVEPFDGLRRLEQPLTLTAPPGAAGEGLAWAENPAVLYRHDLPLHAGAEVLIRSGDTPLLVRRRIGKGEVLVFLGAPCGVPAAGQTPFWAWRDWPRFLRQLTVN